MQRFIINENKIKKMKKTLFFWSIWVIIAITLTLSSIIYDGTLGNTWLMTLLLTVVSLSLNLAEKWHTNSLDIYRNIVPADTEILITELANAQGISAQEVKKHLKFLISTHYIEGIFNDDGTAVILFSEYSYENFTPKAIDSAVNTNLSAENFVECQKCAVKNPSDFKFCPKCGEKIN